MGIPYYFSHIIKTHKSIVKCFKNNTKVINNFYLDANSIIYDVIHTLDFNYNENIENQIIKEVINKLENYINQINPSNIIFIAFDGVAPLAKLEQQRMRRYKTDFLNRNYKINNEKEKHVFNSVLITPGTLFMKNLSNTITSHFEKISNIIVTSSNEDGEGEHKIFQYIRDNSSIHNEMNTFVYGLDADLIMLSLNHLKINNKINNIYLVREAPHFNNLINDTIDINELYMLDIQKLALTIVKELDKEENMFAIHDYVFLCFLLGNDFLPSFPALNIRTGGISKLIEAYKNTMFNELVIQNGIINWKGLYNIILYLTQKEEEYIIKEYELRNKITDNLQYKNNNREEIHIDFEKIPQVEREIEKYINPCENFWKERYYKILFDININETKKKQISLNYIEGLEWTYKYYTDKCCDWRWKYNYHYPPLLEDLIKYIPIFDKEFIKNNETKPVSQLVQLLYVLPKNSLSILDDNIYNKVLNECSHWYSDDCEFLWAFKKYFWESHVILPHVDVDEIERFINRNKFKI